jgi:hypothetical protein
MLSTRETILKDLGRPPEWCFVLKRYKL